MREILFRGKRHDNGEWVYGSLLVEHYTGEEIHEHYRCLIYSPDGRVPWSFIIYDVDPETVGQYTGFTDKNGRNVFEGDIVEIEGWLSTGESLRLQISFIEGDFCLADIDGEYGAYIADIKYMYSDGKNRAEVIGNIRDNPDLTGGAA